MIEWFGTTAGYLAVMLVICLTSVVARRDATRAACVVLANWCAVYVFNATFGTYCPWVWFILIDTLCAWLLLIHPASRMQVVIAGLYIFIQIPTHVAYGALQATQGFPVVPVAQLSYWYVLLFASYLQIAMLLGWGAVDGGRSLYNIVRFGRSHRPVAAGHANVAKRP